MYNLPSKKSSKENIESDTAGIFNKSEKQLYRNV